MAAAAVLSLISDTRATRIGFSRKAAWGSEGYSAIEFTLTQQLAHHRIVETAHELLFFLLALLFI
jgi:hypothetical protein